MFDTPTYRNLLPNPKFQISPAPAPSESGNFKSQISNNSSSSIPIAIRLSPARSQCFRARANASSGHAVWPAMRTGENTSAHAKTLQFPLIASTVA